jgi:hypothetical protein
MSTKEKTKKHKKINHMSIQELEEAKQNCLTHQGGLESRYGREIEFAIVKKGGQIGSVTA